MITRVFLDYQLQLSCKHLFSLARTCANDTDSSPNAVAGNSGFSPRNFIDMHRFLAAKTVMEEDKCGQMTSEEITDLVTVVSIHSSCSARVAMLFKSNQRLRTLLGI